MSLYKGIHADLIAYVFFSFAYGFANVQNMLDINWLQTAKELVKRGEIYDEMFSSFGVIFKEILSSEIEIFLGGISAYQYFKIHQAHIYWQS